MPSSTGPVSAHTLTPTLLDEACVWTAVLVVLAAVSAVLLEQFAFAYSAVVTAAPDLWLAHLVARRGSTLLEHGIPRVASLAGLITARFLVKIALLVLAWYAPSALDFWGTVTGALAYDTTLMVGGSIVAVTRNVAGRGDPR